MKIEGIGQGVGRGVSDAVSAIQAKGPKKVQGDALGQVAPSENPAESDDEKVKGVLRLLQEGHFKGVADVRLRINFADEIAGMDQANLTQIAGEAVPGLLDDVNAQFDALLASGSLTDEQKTAVTGARDAFNAAVQQLGDDFQIGQPPNVDTLISGIRDAFNAATDELEPALGLVPPGAAESLSNTTETPTTPEGETGPTEPAATEPAATEPAATDPTAVTAGIEPSPFQTFMDSLGQVFESALNGLQDTLSSSSALPPVSEPSGNGGAYAKFLAMYNEMRGTGAPAPAPTPTPMVDIVA